MRVLVADNHTLFREGFCIQLQRFNGLGELQEITRPEALKTLADKKKIFDLIFVDQDMLGSQWREGLKNLSDDFSDARIVLLSETEEAGDILDAFDLGVSGYITKQSPDSLIINALRLIMDGNVYVPPAVLKGMQKVNRAEPRVLTQALPDGKNLTSRQAEVLRYLGSGLSNKQIAYEMSVSEATVKLHINALLRHLHVENRTKAVVTAQKMGILEA